MRRLSILILISSLILWPIFSVAEPPFSRSPLEIDLGPCGSATVDVSNSQYVESVIAPAPGSNHAASLLVQTEAEQVDAVVSFSLSGDCQVTSGPAGWTPDANSAVWSRPIQFVSPIYGNSPLEFPSLFTIHDTKLALNHTLNLLL